MSPTDRCSACGKSGIRRGTTTMTRQRGDHLVVRIDGVPTYTCEACGEAMIPGPLAVRLDDAMHDILDALEQAGAEPIPARVAG